MLFKERAKLAMEAISKRQPVTLEQARRQVAEIKRDSQSKNKKGQNVIQGTSDKRFGATSKAEASDTGASEGASEKSGG